MYRKLTCTNYYIIFEGKSFKRIHMKTFLLGWGGMVLKYFSISYIFNTKNDHISSKIKPYIH